MQLHSWSRCPLCSLRLPNWHRFGSSLDSLLTLDFSACVTCLANSGLFGLSRDCLSAVRAFNHGTLRKSFDSVALSESRSSNLRLASRSGSPSFDPTSRRCFCACCFDFFRWGHLSICCRCTVPDTDFAAVGPVFLCLVSESPCFGHTGVTDT